jgi:probable F420-dependent oxidoreductase
MRIYATIDNPHMALADVPAHAKRAERIGFDGLLVPEAVHDPFLISLLALEHTSRLEVMTSVVLAFPRSPTVVAYSAWDLQTLSRGRFALGLGSQVKGNVVGRFAAPWSAPIPRMRDYVGALRAVWRCWQDGTPLSYTSSSYTLSRMQPYFNPGPCDPPKVPVWLGAISSKMMALAGEVADGLMTHPTNTGPRFLREIAWPALAKGAERAGRDPRSVAVLASPFVATGPTAETVRAEREKIREHLAFLYSTPQYHPTLAIHGWADVGERLHKLTRDGHWDRLTAEISDEILDALVPTGTYDGIAATLTDWFGDICSAIALRMPQDSAHDGAMATVVREIRAGGR